MKVVTNRQIQALLKEQQVEPTASPQFWDTYYVLPTRRWVVEVFAPAWVRFVAQLGLEGREQSQDCDDFALLCWAYARFIHSRQMAGTQLAPAGLAFGFYGYVQAATFTGHAINLAIVEDGPMWFEPQTSKELVLDPAEKMTCEFYAF